MNSKVFIASISLVILSSIQMQIIETTFFGSSMNIFGSKGFRESGTMRRHRVNDQKFPFLQGLNKTNVRSFLDIRRNESLTKAEIQEEEDKWASRQNQTVQNVYNEFKANRTAQIEKIKSDVESKLSSLSESAQRIVQEIEDVLEKQNITQSEERQEIKEIINNATKSDLKALKSLIPIIQIRRPKEMRRSFGKKRFMKIDRPRYEMSEEDLTTTNYI
uniref:DUF148 domain-containing protein n=1 Tax=Parastrongyloides trichosuri TaxID=131310 RepID=A0A0N5A6J1_PARTI